MRAILFYTFSWLFLIQVNSQNLQDGLVLYYPFNNNCNDFSGNNYHGINFNAEFTDDLWGNPTSACYFNGINTHVELPGEPALKPPLPVSFSFWVKFYNLDAHDSQIFITDFSKNMYSGIWFGLNPDTYQMQMSYGNAVENCTGPECRRTVTGNTVFQTNQWYHIVGVIAGPYSMNLYVNCENDGGYYSGYGGNLAYTTNLGSIGRTDQVGLTPYYFNGVLDEFYYWDRALSLGEIVQTCLLTNIQSAELIGLKKIFRLRSVSVQNELFVEVAKEVADVSYAIADMLGRVVQRGNFSGKNMQLPVSYLKSGTYILTLKLEGVTENFKFVKTIT